MPTLLLTLPIFLVILSGWLFRKFRVVDETWVHILNLFAYYVALPALIIRSFWEIDFTNPHSLRLIGYSALLILAFSAILFLILLVLPLAKKTKAAIFLVGTTGNTVYIGFPLIASALGQEYASQGSLVAVIYLMLPILISIFIVQFWRKGKHSAASQLKQFAKNPLVISSIVGIAASFVPLYGNVASETIQKMIAMLGATASPVALFALGSFLYGKFLKKDVPLVIISSLTKVLIFPLAILFLQLFLSSTPDPHNITVILASVPSAVTTFVIAQRFNLNQALVCNALLVSTIISFFTIPLILRVFI